MPRQSLSRLAFGGVSIIVFIITIIEVVPKIDAAGQATRSSDNEKSTSYQLRETAIKEALISISKGKLPPNDDRLIDLIAENIREVAIKANDPTVGIDAAGRQAQEAVSEITAAYTAIIFQSSSIGEAQSLLNRYQDTVDKIVEFAKSGNFIVRYRSTPQ